MLSGMRAATIDLGTNSVLLLVAERGEDGRLRALDERCLITRLGEGVDRTGRLSPEPCARTLRALEEYAEVMDRLGATRRAAIGTAVLRDAGESAAFVARAEATLGCPLEVVSGAREAALVLAGARGSFGELPAGTLLFDVGGGSCELILVRKGEPLVTSLQLGAVRLTERHLASDPPRSGELAAARAGARRTLASLPPEYTLTGEVIGLAGTVTTLATVELGLDRYDTERVNGLVLSRAQIAAQLARYASTTLEERRRIPGLEAARADIILGGALIVEEVLERFGAERLRVCDRGVRWGLLRELLEG